MQDHFLFDSDDPKQRGFGCDRKGNKSDGLALRWTWNKYNKKEKPGQCCYAELGKGWSLSAIFWHSNYEALIQYYGEHITSYKKDAGEKYIGPVLVTRIQAQLKAEQMLIDIWKELSELLDKKGIVTAKIIARLEGKRKTA